MEDSSRGALTAAGLSCASCGTELPPNSKFCNECGAPVTHLSRSAEYKQVTVLFADVVHSMDIAAAVGPERLREIMTDVVDRAAVVVQHFGGTVGSFTGDGIMAVFGAPTALEDHAIRACLAALAIQEEAKRLAVDVRERDGVELLLRVGLNSGQVIAGEIGQAHSVTPPSASRSVWPSGWSRSLSGDVLRCSGSRASVSSSLSGAHPGTDYITKLQRSVCGVGTDENGFH